MIVELYIALAFIFAAYIVGYLAGVQEERRSQERELLRLFRHRPDKL